MNRISYWGWAWLLALASFLLRLPSFFLDLPPYIFVDEAIYTYGVYSIALSTWGWVPYNYLAGGVNYYLPAVFVYIFHNYFNISFSLNGLIIFCRFLGPGILSCLSIPLIYAAGRRLCDEKIAFIAAFVLAFSPLMLELSRIWYPDHYAILFSTLSLYALVRIVTKNSAVVWNYILLGIAIGLSTSTKYNGLFFIFLIPIAHILVASQEKKWDERLRILFLSPLPWVALVFVVITFLVTNPFIFVDLSKYINAIELTQAVYVHGSAGLMVAHTSLFYSQLLMFSTFGILGGLVICIGLLSLMWQKKWAIAIILLFMPIIFIAMMGSYKNALIRNISVLIPYTALLFAIGLNIIKQFLTKKTFIIILIVLLAEPCIRITLNTIHYFFPDSRKMAVAWVNQNIPLQSDIGIGGIIYMYPLDTNKFKVVPLPFPPSSSQCVSYYYIDQWELWLFGHPTSIFLSPYYSDNQYRNVGGYYFKTEHEGIQEWLKNYNLIHQVSGFYYGPSVYIYQRKTPCPTLKPT